MRRDAFPALEQHYALKHAFERLWGDEAFLELKHSSDIKTWKRHCQRTLQATRIAVSDTVQVADSVWHETFLAIVDHGLRRIEGAAQLDELFQDFAATYMELSFHQLGFFPNKASRSSRPLRKGTWQLSHFRSVQYVQTECQKQHLALALQERKQTE
ncbi:MAG: hypothetical protein O9313_17560 [Acetobacteraceae bacterium]|jgi:hypothetical protein|nr:hypothetical protein [Acetobacteraceae bacterium]